MTRLEIFCNLGYRKDPFFGAHYQTSDELRVQRILTMAVESHAMVSIVGTTGIGKSKSVEVALAKIGARIVRVRKGDKTRVTISDIEKALILDLSDDAPKAGGEVRGRQLRPIVGDQARKRKVVLLIEEAQRLHGATLRSLKTLREIDWCGETELFTIVLVAQSDPMARAGVTEVRLRSDCVRMHGLSAEEAAGYVFATVGKHFEDAAIAELSTLPQATNFLELQALAIEVLDHAIDQGHDRVTVQDVRDVGAHSSEQLPRVAKAAKAVPAAGKGLAAVLARKNGQENDNKEVAAC
jgi:type II secretory pathway predicted ATPase ExeA